MKRSLLPGLAAALALAAHAAPALPQERMHTQASLLLGPSPYDMSGVGTGFAANLGATTRIGRGAFLVEPGLGYFTYRTRFGGRSQWLFPEIDFAAEASLGSLRPYLGAGFGAGFETRAGPNQVDLTLHAAAGLRLALGGSWGMRTELRLRSVDPFHGNTSDIGIGITRGIY